MQLIRIRSDETYQVFLRPRLTGSFLWWQMKWQMKYNGITHYAYHVGQLVLPAKHFAGGKPEP